MSCCSEAEALRLPARRARGPRVLDPEGLSRHIDTLYRAAWALCGSQHDAEDLVQETLVRAWQHPEALNPERGSVRAWLSRRKARCTAHSRSLEPER